MKQLLTEEYLYAHIPAAEEALCRALAEEPPVPRTFSPRFLRKMRTLLKFERRSPAARTAARVGRLAAILVLGVLALHGDLLGTVKAYREGFFEIVTDVRRKYTAFYVETDGTVPVSEFVPIPIPWVPEEYELVDHVVTPAVQLLVFENVSGKDISVQQTILGNSPTYMDTEGAFVEQLEILQTQVYVITEGNMTQMFFASGNSEFSLSGIAGYDTLLEVADRILRSLENG